ncbi:hypothetical protein ATB53_15190 [Xanthomonas translucens]|uniref:Helicase C-terminal domain-containing protein n=2 Tax=Xanthomonas campestris pv. translucens TaxID=343 RepID=A0A125PVL8_XANCT|nr:hypothetical protein ATB53_15190 [Xanthomonas translucens]
MCNDQWQQMYARLAELVRAHRTTLVFVNTRRMAERTARHVGELLGNDAVAAHHGSLAREARLLAEQRLKAGQLQVLVATASLELGLDIGDVDLVCQLGSPRSIASFLQRAERSGHAVGGTPKARLFPQSRDDLVECAALLDCVRRGELDALRILDAPLDVLAQQLVAEVACQEWDEDALYTLLRGAWLYATLLRERLRMLSDGFSTRLGPRAGYLHRDAVHRRVRARHGARMAALTSGGTIPETGDYSVLLEPQAEAIGTVNEDFAVESLSGDVFQLGNASYRILRVEPGRVRVEDARGAPPNIPFWLGEAPGRSDELSAGVSRLRAQLERCLEQGGAAQAQAWLHQELALDTAAAQQLVDYLGRARTALDARPYAFLDDAPLEERRTQAVHSRRYQGPDSADDLGRLDPDAIASVFEDAWPQPRSRDEMLEALVALGVLTDREAAAHPAWPHWLAELAADARATRLQGNGGDGVALWVAAESLALIAPLYPQATAQPRIALLALQQDGYILTGRFTPEAGADEWCERHLLAHIHRYTLGRLRREIEPVALRDYARFLFRWRHLDGEGCVACAEALASVLAQLEGFEAPAALWEADLLPTRVRDYAPAWLDELCSAGRTLWTRLRPAAASAVGTGSLRSTPIMLLPRRRAAQWSRLAPAAVEPGTLGSRAQKVADYLGTHGTSFFDAIADATRLLSTELEEALAELVAAGRIHCDSYAGLRALLVPASKRSSALARRRRRVPLYGIQDAGRWALLRFAADAGDAAAHGESLEHLARTLPRRYGVICWRLLEREAAWLPPWCELLRVYQRLEARGEIRGGRFIGGLSGEQFALPEAIGLLRQVRRQPHDGAWLCVAAADPANLLGSVLPGSRVPRVPGARVLYRAACRWRPGLPSVSSRCRN